MKTLPEHCNVLFLFAVFIQLAALFSLCLYAIYGFNHFLTLCWCKEKLCVDAQYVWKKKKILIINSEMKMLTTQALQSHNNPQLFSSSPPTPLRKQFFYFSHSAFVVAYILTVYHIIYLLHSVQFDEQVVRRWVLWKLFLTQYHFC